jgi:primosomal protein N' (replication factor Y)
MSGAPSSEVPQQRLKQVLDVLDETPALPPDLLELLSWCAGYYHHPIGEVVCSALPGLLRHGRSAREMATKRWRITTAGHDIDLAQLKNAARQRALLLTLREHARGLDADELNEACGDEDWRRAVRVLTEKGWVECIIAEREAPRATIPTHIHDGPALNADQHAATTEIIAAQGFQAFLLDGVTGSGKTEVYFALMEHMIRAGKQTLLLVPEIGLTPQLVARVRKRFSCGLAVLHSGLAEGERLAAWNAAASAAAPIIIGTRSAVFTPAPNLGAIIVDEEHDASYKQQDSLRYHARDTAVIRAQRLGIPVVLGSATPALETLHNCAQHRYKHLVLARRAGAATPPAIRLIDLRADRPTHGLSSTLERAITAHLARDEQVLLFLNRRGYAPTLLCEDCGWLASCRRCDAHLVLHRARGLLRCHHCGAEEIPPQTCPQCSGADLRPVGQGTERMEETLRERFAGVTILRIDRDSTRRRGAMEALMNEMRGGRRQILLGTQMLAKGHDLPNVTLVGILDADQGMFGVDFRAGERMGQLITQVAGRAGRADKPGAVYVQTRCPEHPLLGTLLAQNYQDFARGLLDERRLSAMPPYRNMAILRAESVREGAPEEFLSAARARLLTLTPAGIEQPVELLGPAPAPMARRAGHYRAQLLLLAAQRARLHALLSALVPALDSLAAAGRVRWSLDVDPADEY